MPRAKDSAAWPGHATNQRFCSLARVGSAKGKTTETSTLQRYGSSMVPTLQPWSNSHTLNEPPQEQPHHTQGAGGRGKKTGTKLRSQSLGQRMAFCQNVYSSFNRKQSRDNNAALNMSLAQVQSHSMPSVCAQTQASLGLSHKHHALHGMGQ